MTPLASHGPAPHRRDIRYAVLGEDFGEGGLPVEGLGMHGWNADDAVALADGVAEFSCSCQASQKRMRALRYGSLRAARS
jgi:hypothetical protein